MKKNYVIPEMEMKEMVCNNLLETSPGSGDGNHLGNSEDEDAGAKPGAIDWDQD